MLVKTLSNTSTDTLIVQYNEMDELLQNGQLQPKDYQEFIDSWKEPKKRGYII